MDNTKDEKTYYEYLNKFDDDIINYALDLGVKNAYSQEGDTSDESFIPPFDLEGL